MRTTTKVRYVGIMYLPTYVVHISNANEKYGNNGMVHTYYKKLDYT